MKIERPQAITLRSPNASSRNGRKIDSIVLHHTASNNGTQDIRWMRTPRSQVSAHYVIGRNGRIFQLVPETLKAWHAGKSALRGVPTDMNARSIGIEIVNDGKGTPFTQAQYAALAKLVAYLKAKYDVDERNIVGHRDIAVPRGRKNDPADNFSWARLRRDVLGIERASVFG